MNLPENQEKKIKGLHRILENEWDQYKTSLSKLVLNALQSLDITDRIYPGPAATLAAFGLLLKRKTENRVPRPGNYFSTQLLKFTPVDYRNSI